MLKHPDLDTKDLRLLFLLDRDSRISFSDAARSLRLSEQAVAYRLEKLRASGIVKQLVPFINLPRLGLTHYKVYLKFLSLEESAEQGLIEFLCKQENVLWVVTMSSRFDISFSILARSLVEYSKLYQGLEAKFGLSIREKNVVTVIKAPGFTRGYLVGESKGKLRYYGSEYPSIAIDSTEARLLKALSADARQSLKSLAEASGLTVDIVRYRLKKLEDCGLIRGYTVLLDLQMLGYDYYVLFLSFHGITKSLEERLMAFAENHSNVLFFVKVIGEHDYQIELEVPGVSALDSFLREFRLHFAKNLRDLEVLRIIKEHKFDFFPFGARYFS